MAWVCVEHVCAVNLYQQQRGLLSPLIPKLGLEQNLAVNVPFAIIRKMRCNCICTAYGCWPFLLKHVLIFHSRTTFTAYLVTPHSATKTPPLFVPHLVRDGVHQVCKQILELFLSPSPMTIGPFSRNAAFEVFAIVRVPGVMTSPSFHSLHAMPQKMN